LNDCVVSPNADARAVAFSDVTEILDGPVSVDDRLFEGSWIGVDCMLDDEGNLPLVNLGEMLQEWSDVLGPEDHAIYVIRSERDAADAGVERIDRLAISSS
jgi:hypothetical protein